MSIEVLPKLVGRVSIDEYLNGQLLRNVAKSNNVVTNGCYNNIALFLGGTAPSTLPVSYLLFGYGTTAASQTDTALGAAYSSPQLTTTATYPSSGSVQFVYTLGTTQLNGSPISEAGLFSSASPAVLLAHYVFGSSAKQSGATWVVTWNISFPIA